MTFTFPSPSIILPPPVFRGFTTMPLHLSHSLSAGAESSEVWMWMDEVLVYWASSLPSRNLLRATTCRRPPGAERWITEINLNVPTPLCHGPLALPSISHSRYQPLASIGRSLSFNHTLHSMDSSWSLSHIPHDSKLAPFPPSPPLHEDIRLEFEEVMLINDKVEVENNMASVRTIFSVGVNHSNEALCGERGGRGSERGDGWMMDGCSVKATCVKPSSPINLYSSPKYSLLLLVMATLWLIGSRWRCLGVPRFRRSLLATELPESNLPQDEGRLLSPANGAESLNCDFLDDPLRLKRVASALWPGHLCGDRRLQMRSLHFGDFSVQGSSILTLSDCSAVAVQERGTVSGGVQDWDLYLVWSSSGFFLSAEDFLCSVALMLSIVSAMTFTFPSPSIILPPPVFRGFTTMPLHLSHSLSAGAESSEVWMWMDEVLVYWASSLPSRNLLRATTCRRPPGAERWITEINLNVPTPLCHGPLALPSISHSRYQPLASIGRSLSFNHTLHSMDSSWSLSHIPHDSKLAPFPPSPPLHEDIRLEFEEVMLINDKVEVENNMASVRTIFSVGVNHSNEALCGERGGRGSERGDGWMMDGCSVKATCVKPSSPINLYSSPKYSLLLLVMATLWLIGSRWRCLGVPRFRRSLLATELPESNLPQDEGRLLSPANGAESLNCDFLDDPLRFCHPSLCFEHRKESASETSSFKF
ncbi:hypothetical protein BT69DRAFT_1372104 [Atractiella rhizophila]|nr:hypothetical protein BT69DRAFT_1372104 [Atractiella rhizophila]